MTPTFLLGDNHGEYAKPLDPPLGARTIRDAVIIHVGDGHEGYPECGLPELEPLNQ